MKPDTDNPVVSSPASPRGRKSAVMTRTRGEGWYFLMKVNMSSSCTAHLSLFVHISPETIVLKIRFRVRIRPQDRVQCSKGRTSAHSITQQYCRKLMSFLESLKSFNKCDIRNNSSMSGRPGSSIYSYRIGLAFGIWSGP